MTLARTDVLAVLLLGATAPAQAQPADRPPPDGQPPMFGGSQSVEVDIADSFDLPQADAQAQALVQAADAFLDNLSDAQGAAVLYEFDDAEQRGNWSNLPNSAVNRGGLARGGMTEEQLAALDRLLSTLMSSRGMENIRFQLAAEDMLESRGDALQFSSDYYYISFLGEPASISRE